MGLGLHQASQALPQLPETPNDLLNDLGSHLMTITGRARIVVIKQDNYMDNLGKCCNNLGLYFWAQLCIPKLG